MAESDYFLFTDKSTGGEIVDGVIIFKIILHGIKSSTVVGVHDVE